MRERRRLKPIAFFTLANGSTVKVYPGSSEERFKSALPDGALTVCERCGGLRNEWGGHFCPDVRATA